MFRQNERKHYHFAAMKVNAKISCYLLWFVLKSGNWQCLVIKQYACKLTTAVSQYIIYNCFAVSKTHITWIHSPKLVWEIKCWRKKNPLKVADIHTGIIHVGPLQRKERAGDTIHLRFSKQPGKFTAYTPCNSQTENQTQLEQAQSTCL